MRAFTIIFCLLLLLGASFFIYRSLAPTKIPYDGTLDRCLGERLGQEALKVASGTDEIVLFTLDEKQVKNPMYTTLLHGLRKSLQQSPSIRLVLESPMDGLSSECMSAADFADITASHPNAKVIVSFLGTPCSGPKSQGGIPKLVAFSLSPELNWNELFANESMTAVIWPRPQHVSASQPTGTDECSKLFAASYVIVTRNNFHEYDFDKLPTTPLRQR